MRVLLDCSRLMLGGGIQVGLAIVKNAAACHSHEWSLVLSSAMSGQMPPETEASLGKVWRFRQSGSIVAQLKESASLLPQIERQTKPDVIFTVFGPVLWRPKAPHLVGFAFPSLVFPEVYYSQISWSLLGRWKAKMYDQWSLLRAKRSECFVVETETVKRRLVKLLSIAENRVFVVRNSYSPLFQQAALRRTAAYPRNGFRVIVPAAYYPHKNLEIVPHVAASLRDRYQVNCEFLLTVDPQSTGWKRINSVVQARSVASLVRTIGPVPHANIADLYSSADAVFFPTLLECSTAVYPESFMAEVPLATSDRDFAHELCGDAAAYFDPLSGDQAASVLCRVLTDRGLRERLVAAGRRVLKENYPSPEEKWQAQLRCIEAVSQSTVHPCKRLFSWWSA